MRSPWITGARPRTLPAAVVPVAVGTAVAVHEHGSVWWKGLVALVVSLAMQVGVNYANDYSDGVRGADDVRVGPLRLTASGTKPAGAVKRAAGLAFTIAAAAGLVLVVTTAWWLVLIGAAAVLSGWFYTGGPRPYGYAGLGEAFVFVFFGLVATAGSAYVQTGRLTGLALVTSVPVGLAACALLVVNNLRDIPGDAVAGKRTLAVRLGDRRTRTLFGATVLAPALLVAAIAVVLAVAGGALGGAVGLVGAVGLAAAGAATARRVAAGPRGPALIPVLARTGQLQLVLGAVLSLALVLSR